MCKIIRTQELSIREYRRNDQKDGHSGKQESTESVINILVMYCKICDTPCNISKPHQIRNNEIFAEWNIIIQRGMYHMKVCSHIFLYIGKPCEIDKKIIKYQKMLVFFKKSQETFLKRFHSLHLSKIYWYFYELNYNTAFFNIQLTFGFLNKIYEKIKILP